MEHKLNHFIDSVSMVVVVGVLAKALPIIAAVFSIIWTGIRIYEWYRFRIILNKPKQFK